MKLIKNLKGLALSAIFAFGTMASAANNDSYTVQEQFDTLFEATIKLLKDNNDLQKRVNDLEEKLSYIEDLESKIKRFDMLSAKLINIDILEQQVRDTVQTLNNRMIQLRAANDLITSKNDELSKLANILVDDNAKIRSHTISIENKALINEADIAAIKKEQIRDKVALGLKKNTKELSQADKIKQLRAEINQIGSASVIITTKINVRKAASQKSAKIGSLPKDSVAIIKDIFENDKGTWLELKNGGYIFGKFTKPLKEPKLEVNENDDILKQIENILNGAKNLDLKKSEITKAQEFLKNEAVVINNSNNIDEAKKNEIAEILENSENEIPNVSDSEEVLEQIDSDEKQSIITKIVNDPDFLALPEASYDEKGNLIIPANYDFQSDLCNTDCLRIGIGGAICKCNEEELKEQN